MIYCLLHHIYQHILQNIKKGFQLKMMGTEKSEKKIKDFSREGPGEREKRYNSGKITWC